MSVSILQSFMHMSDSICRGMFFLPPSASAAPPAMALPKSRPARAAKASRRLQQTVPAEPAGLLAASYLAGDASLNYRLHLPATLSKKRPQALVVMLHGCAQEPEGFAAGTGMLELAEEQGFALLLPAAEDGLRCWNWFDQGHQQRGSGEPAMIAGLALQVARQYGINRRRIFIAGLSAGGAMAATVAAEYPDVFAAVGVHSGLPARSANSVDSALRAMRTGHGIAALARDARGAGSALTQGVPTIVFHGGDDHTVHPRNGLQVLSACMELESTDGKPLLAAEADLTLGGRRCTRSMWSHPDGSPFAEHWLVHGAGHAWSGGRREGAYTDVKGPDASREMLRFFASLPHR